MTSHDTSSEARDAALAVVRRLRRAGHEAFFVGGCVRELLLGAEPDDYDVTTDATPDRVAELFERVVEVGKRFGVSMVVERGIVTEVATFRTDGSYTDGRRPDSVRFSSAAEDVARRDFTINALLLDPETGEVIDHVGGQADLRARLLRTVGDPRRRFAEDRLRLLRAARFTARLGFTLEAETADACRELAPGVASVSPERVQQELTRMLAHPSRAEAAALLASLGLLPHVLPEVASLPPDRLDHVVSSLRRLPPEASACAAWATLLHESGPGAASSVALRLRMSRDDADRIHALVRDRRCIREAPAWELSKVRTLLASPLLGDLLAVAHAEGDCALEIAAAVAHVEEARLRWGTELPPPLLTGDDVIALGVERGPRVKAILQDVRREQLEERLASREDALRHAAGLAASA